MTGYSFSTPVWDGGTWVTPAVAEVAVARNVNGPEDQPRKQDAPAGWDKIDWRAHEGQVRRLRQRIFTAAQEQDWPRVRNLQKLMLRSRSNTLVSVRQVTQRNAGRKTAGIDGEVALTPEARADVAVRVHQSISSWRPRAVRRVYPRRRHSAALSSDPLGFVIVTHPFHPLNGQRLEILYAKRRGADTVFVCAGGVSGQMTLPQAWTDRREPPGSGRLSAEGLAALGAATRALQGR